MVKCMRKKQKVVSAADKYIEANRFEKSPAIETPWLKLPPIERYRLKCLTFDEVFNAGVEWADAHPNWISVKDKSPEPLCDVLAYGKYEGVKLAYYCGPNWWGVNGNEPNFFSFTHWMPLPDIPKQVCKNEEYGRTCN
jgi:hypothetical protein